MQLYVYMCVIFNLLCVKCRKKEQIIINKVAYVTLAELPVFYEATIEQKNNILAKINSRRVSNNTFVVFWHLKKLEAGTCYAVNSLYDVKTIQPLCDVKYISFDSY